MGVVTRCKFETLFEFFLLAVKSVDLPNLSSSSLVIRLFIASSPVSTVCHFAAWHTTIICSAMRRH